MNRYFFHIDGPRPQEDTAGILLSDDSAAWDEALQTVRNIEDNLKPGEEWRLEVAEDGRSVFLLTVASRRI